MFKILSKIAQKIIGVPRYIKLKSYIMAFFYKLSNKNNLGYDSSFYAESLDTKGERYKKLANSIIQQFSPQSVVDIGCGAGGICIELQKQGVEIVKGYDFSEDALAIARKSGLKYTAQVDLTQTSLISDQSDVCLCLEVAEHLPSVYANNLCKLLSSIAPVLIFTAAKPGQGGHLHFNEQPPEYWFNLFRQYGMEFSSQDTESMLNSFHGIYMGDYQENLMIFHKQNNTN